MARAKRAEMRTIRDHEAWRLRLLGWSQQQIAEHLDVDQSLVSRALNRIEKQLIGEFTAEVEAVKARQAAQLENVYAEAMEQWARSCDDEEKTTTIEGRSRALGEAMVDLPPLVTHVIRGQSGNPALLAQAMNALAGIRSIYGLDAPAKQEISGPAGGPVAIREVVVELPRGES